MNSNQSLISDDLEVELSFRGFIPEHIKDNIDEETRIILTSLDSWSFVFNRWIHFIRNDASLICPQIIRTNNIFSLGLLLTDDLSITKLNKQWRRKDMPTDVLSFAALDGDFKPLLDNCVELGDIIVSVDTALKQSKVQQHSLSDELRWLVSHGFLHLLGWDHPSPSKLDKMLNVQEQLLKVNEKAAFTKGISID